MDELSALRRDHELLKPAIEKRLGEFRETWNNADDAAIFRELVFCLFTPQSRARSCWSAVERVCDNDLLLHGSAEQISACMAGVRFHHTKAGRVVDARKKHLKGLKARISGFANPKQARDWLVQNVNGMSFKESSHFLRNIGMGRDLAILDRHILKNLVKLGVIPEVPASMTPKRYLDIEECMAAFSEVAGIPMDHLDMILWYREAGEIFK